MNDSRHSEDSMQIIVNTEEEKKEVDELLIEVSERPHLYDSDAQERFLETEVIVRG